MSEHIEQLRTLFQHFKAVGLRAHPAKTIAAANCIPYLGHLISAYDLRPDSYKVAAMQSLQPPNCLKRLQAHLGLFNYYRVYIPDFSRIAQPLYALLRKGVAYVWGDQQQAAYKQLQQALTSPDAVLAQPDRNKPFHLFTDWSKAGIAAILNQYDDQGNPRMVACLSRSLNNAESNYPSWNTRISFPNPNSSQSIPIPGNLRIE